MARTLNGFGTSFYGRRDFRADDTYTTTEWIVFAFVPIAPLRSLRVRHLHTDGIPPFFSTHEYKVYETTSPDWRQVVCVYAYVVALIAWELLVGSLLCRIHSSPQKYRWEVH